MPAIAIDIEPEIICNGLEEMHPVPGRFEYVECGQSFPVVVDYAHTPDGLIQVLETAKFLFPGRIILVFGATGDRDKFKRPEMGKIAVTYSDYVIVTSDDPHSEDPDKIAEEIITGIPKDKKDRYIKIIDRKKAIEKALSIATQD